MLGDYSEIVVTGSGLCDSASASASASARASAPPSPRGKVVLWPVDQAAFLSVDSNAESSAAFGVTSQNRELRL